MVDVRCTLIVLSVPPCLSVKRSVVSKGILVIHKNKVNLKDKNKLNLVTQT